MLDNQYFKDGHLTQLALLMLESDAMTKEEKQIVLFHLSSCDECLEAYTNSLTDEMLIDPPQELEQNILNLVSHEFNNKKHSKLLAIQFTKLAIAVSITMVLFFGGIFEYIGNAPLAMMKANQQHVQEKKPKENEIFQFTQDLANSFNEFAHQINTGTKGDNENESKQ